MKALALVIGIFFPQINITVFQLRVIILVKYKIDPARSFGEAN